MDNEPGEVITPKEDETPTEENPVETPEPKEPTDETPSEPQEKPQESLEARKARLSRELKQVNKKLGITEEPKKIKSKSDELDFGQLAFYNSKSDTIKIESDEDISFLQQTIEETGKDQKSILGAKWFQAELKERKEQKSVARATPSPSRLPGDNAKTKIDYWLNRKELPPNTPENKELIAKIFEAKYEREKAGI